MKKSKVTNEQLLKEVKRGFSDTRKYTDQKIGDLSKSTDRKIDDLAGMVQKGFEDVDKKFDVLTRDVNARFDRIEGRLDGIEIELIDIKKKLANVIDRGEFEFLKERVQRLENVIANKKR